MTVNLGGGGGWLLDYVCCAEKSTTVSATDATSVVTVGASLAARTGRTDKASSVVLKPQPKSLQSYGAPGGRGGPARDACPSRRGPTTA